MIVCICYSEEVDDERACVIKDDLTKKFTFVISVVLITLMALLYGCGGKNHPKDREMTVQELEKNVLLTLPADAVVLNSSDGGDRGGTYFEWLIYSPSGFSFDQNQSGYKKTPLSLETSIRLVQSRIPRTKLSSALAAFATEWENQAFVFDATVLQTVQGEYLLVMRYSK